MKKLSSKCRKIPAYNVLFAAFYFKRNYIGSNYSQFLSFKENFLVLLVLLIVWLI